MTVKLDQAVPWGRSFDEHRLMFDLSDADLGRRILGCGDGPASFNAEATQGGINVVSCDPIYGFSGGAIRQRVEETYPTIIDQVKANPSPFVWERFADPDDLGRCRLAAMERFLADFDAGKRQGRYVAAGLPRLPFVDNSFDLAICSHFLFLYSEQFDGQFHIAAIDELLRVAREARIFPLLGLDGNPSPHVEVVLAHADAAGLRAERVQVPYEFQRGGNEVLRLKRPAA